MDKRVELLGLALAFVAAALYTTVQIVSGVNFFSAIKIVLVLSPFILALIAAQGSIWLGLGIGLLPFFFSMQVPILSRLSIAVVFAGTMAFFVFAQIAIKKENTKLFRPWYSRTVLAAAGIVLLRFAYDRPGSLSMGGTGGGGQAILYVMGFVGFWAFIHIAAKDWDPRKNLLVLVVVAGIAFVVTVLRAPSLAAVVYNAFHRTGWLLLSALLAVVLYLREKNVLKDNLSVYGVVAFILGVAAMSPHRSRPVMAAGMVLAMAYIYRRLNRIFIFMVILGVLGVGSLAAFMPDKIPLSMKRSLSVFIPMGQEYMRRDFEEAGMSYETGWESDFRTTMYELAWNRIKKSPVVGAGFTLDIETVLREYYSSGAGAGMAVLALAGGYHNSLLALAVFCGLPAALLSLVAITGVMVRFVRSTRRVVDPQFKMFAVTIVGFVVASSLQMLINGSAYDFFVVMSLLGMMAGMMTHTKLYADREAKAEQSPGAFLASNRFEKSYRQYYY